MRLKYIKAIAAIVGSLTAVQLYAQESLNVGSTLPNSDIVKSYDEEQRIDMLMDNRAQYSVGSSAVVISGEELRRNHHQNLISALAGRVPGLIISTSSSEPNAETYSTNLRGNGEPLFLVDGVVSDVTSINIYDVESVTIIKDAATTLYGMQAPNGIINIKTKRAGKSNGEPSISVNANYSLQTPTTTPKVLGSSDHVSLTTQAYINDGYASSNPYNSAEIEGFTNGGDPIYYPDNDWYSMYMASKVQTVDVHVSAVGSGENVSYYTSIGYQAQTSPFKATEEQLKAFGADVFDVRSNLDFKVNNFISGYANVYGRINRNVGTNYEDGSVGIIESIFDFAPTDHGPLTPTGTDAYPSGQVVINSNTDDSPYGLINKSGYIQEQDVDLFTNVGLDFNLSALTEGLKAYVSMAYRGNYVSQLIGTANYARYRRVEDTYPYTLSFEAVDVTTYQDEPLEYTKETVSTFEQDITGGLYYDRIFSDKHWLKLNSYVKYNYENPSDITAIHPVKRLTFAGQATYGFKDLLFVDYMASYQGSEEFAEGNRYGFFNSGALSFVVSNLDFLKDNPVLTYLRLRGSYGTVGSDDFGDDRFIYAEDFNVDGGTTPVSYLPSSVVFTAMGNSDLTWETTEIATVGLEATLFNKVSLSAEYFRNNKTNILIENTITPSIMGVPEDALSMINAGHTLNRGVELSLGYAGNINQDLTIGATGHFMYYRKTVEYDGELERLGYLYPYSTTGFREDQCWGYQVDYSNGNGYFNSTQEIFDSGLTYSGMTQPRAGDFIYVDQNNDFVIDENDLVPMGQTTTPQINWGAELYVQYKQFDLSALFQGVGMWGGFNSGLGYYSSSNNGTFFENHLTAWTPERYANGETITGPAVTITGSSSQQSNDYWYQNKSYMRLKNLEIGYSLPNQWCKNANISNLRVYVGGVNLFTFDKLNNDNHDVQSSVDAFPIYRYFNFGANITF